MSFGKSVGVAFGYRLEGRGSIPGRRKERDTGSGTHPAASYSVGARNCFIKGKTVRS
jgi:hypothetical protein